MPMFPHSLNTRPLIVDQKYSDKEDVAIDLEMLSDYYAYTPEEDRLILSPMLIPAAKANPWPKEPVEKLSVGTKFSGCPPKIESLPVNDLKVFLLIMPLSYKTEYNAKHPWPLLKTKSFIFFFFKKNKFS